MGALRFRGMNRPGRRTTVLAVLVSAVLAVGGQAGAGVGHPGGVGVSRAGSAAGVMETAAGGAGGPAMGTRVILASACGVSYASGMVYAADGATVRRVNPRTGLLVTPAGFPIQAGATEPLGDGGPATSAFLDNACGATADHAGDIVIADTGGNRIQIVTKRTGRLFGQAVTAGDIYTVAGTGTAGYSGNDGPARKATLDNPSGVAVDGMGNLVIADTGNQVIRVVAKRAGTFYGQAMKAGDIYTVAGDGGAGYSGNGGPATAAELHSPSGVAVDAAGNLLIADTSNQVIRVVAAVTGTFYGQPMTAGDIYTVAGDGGAGYSGNGGPATAAELNSPGGVAVDAAGNLLIADTANQVIRVVAEQTGMFYGQAMTAGDIYTVAGDGGAGFAGDGGPATSAELNSPGGVAVDGMGNLVIADTGNHRLRVVAAATGRFYGRAMTAGDIYTVAGTKYDFLSGLGGPATSAQFLSGREYGAISGVTVDHTGNVVFDTISSPRVLVVPPASGTFYGRAMTAGHVYSIAGDGTVGFGGDGGPATKAKLMYPSGLGVDQAGNVLICDSQNGRIRVVAAHTGTFYGQAMTAGDIYTIAGGGSGGDGGPAVGAELSLPSGVTVDSAGNVLIAAAGDNSIRVVAAKTGTFYGQAMTAGDIYTIVSGLNFPEGVAVDRFGNVVIGDPNIQVIQVLAEATGTFYGVAMTAGNLYAVAGNGTAGYSGDGGSATAAEINSPNGIAVDTTSNLIIIPDTLNRRIRVVPDTSGTYYGQAMTAGHIYTVAGDGTEGCAGASGPATAAELGWATVAVPTPAGGLVIADGICQDIREVTG
jgi:trimeric autotransporter adhesin